MLNSRLWHRAALALVFAALTGPLAFAVDEQRVVRIKEEIASLEAVLADNPAAKPQWEPKLQALRQELDILQKRELIELREENLLQDVRTQPREQLHEKLRAIEPDTTATETRLRDLAVKRSKISAERLTLKVQIQNAGAEVTPVQRAERGEQFFTKNEELRAAALQQEAAENELALQRQAQTLREFLRVDETVGMKPSLRTLWQRRTQLQSGTVTAAQFAALAAALGENLHISEEGLNLARQKLTKFDEELQLLEKQTGFLRRNDKLEELLVRQRAQKQVLGARLPFLVSQVDALRKSHEALLLRRDLQISEGRLLQQEFDTMRSAYFNHLLWPATEAGVIVLLYLLVSRTLLVWRYKREELYLARRLGRYLTTLLVMVVAALYLLEDMRVVAATLGIVSAAVVISLQDVCASFFGWFVIMLGGKFTIGDRLEIEGALGDVLDIQLLRTTLLEVNNWLGVDQPTGRVLIIPNNFIFKSKVFNFSHGHPYIWSRIDVTVTFGTPAASAMALFHKALEEETRECFGEARRAAADMVRRYGVEDAEYQPKIYTHIADSGVTFSLIFVCHYRQTPTVRNRINRRIIAEIETHPHIQLAYNTLSVLASAAEHNKPSAVLGKEVTRAPFPDRPAS